MWKLASTMSKVGCRKRKLKALTNAKCWMRKKECSGLYIPLNLKIELENLTVAYEKLNVESGNLNVA